MILYFSGTGNSAYVAKRIGEEIQDEVFNLFKRIRDRDYSRLSSSRPWVIVVPTYAWRIPRIVHEWLMKTELDGSRDIYFVMTCGGANGNAGAYLEKLCEAKDLNNQGCASIVMPENYIALFNTPGREDAMSIIRQAKPRISDIAQHIRKGRRLPNFYATFKDKLSSGLINDIFYPMFVHAKRFYVTDACISCGRCERVCPLRNIRIENGKPVWGKHCTHCMACICRCPKEAIEYGRHSRGLVRYICPEEDS